LLDYNKRSYIRTELRDSIIITFCTFFLISRIFSLKYLIKKYVKNFLICGLINIHCRSKRYEYMAFHNFVCHTANETISFYTLYLKNIIRTFDKVPLPNILHVRKVQMIVVMVVFAKGPNPKWVWLSRKVYDSSKRSYHNLS
jgi:hypothetical protein